MWSSIFNLSRTPTWDADVVSLSHLDNRAHKECGIVILTSPRPQPGMRMCVIELPRQQGSQRMWSSNSNLSRTPTWAVDVVSLSRLDNRAHKEFGVVILTSPRPQPGMRMCVIESPRQQGSQRI